MKSLSPKMFNMYIFATLLFVGQHLVAQVNMSATGSHTQNFNTLANTGSAVTWTDNVTLANWYSQRTGTGNTYSPSTGSATTGTLYSYGIDTNSDRALGSIGSSGDAAGHFAHGVLLKNTSGNIMTDVKVSYTLEQWRKSGVTSPQDITFYYKISSSTINELNPNSNLGWIQVAGLTLSSPVNTATASSLDGNLPANRVSVSNISIPGLSLAINEYIMLKWEDPDHSSSDHGLAIDDVTINWTTAISPTVNGTIAAGEYGSHINGGNKQESITGNWYMTWDATNLYVAIEGTNTTEPAVLYLDKNPIVPVNGGTYENGNLAGFGYEDGTNFANLPFRSDLLVYFKDGYWEYRTANGTGGWSDATSGTGSYASSSGNREIAIPWSAIGGQPNAFNWFGYVAYGGGGAYASVPTSNPGSNGGTIIGSSARWSHYYTVSDISTLPFSRNSYTFTLDTDVTNFSAISVYDFTMNTSGKYISRTGSTTGNWNIGGNLTIGDGTIYLGSGAGTYGNTNIAGNLNLLGGSFDMDESTAATIVAGNVTIASGATLKLSTAVGGDLNVAKNWTNNGTFTANSRQFIFNGTTPQTVSGATTFAYLKINNTTGVTLLSPITVTNQMDLSSGKITLGASNFIMDAAASFINNSATSYLVTNSTGALVRSNFGATSKIFPVGLEASYTPLTIANTGTANDLSLIVSSPPTHSVFNATKIVNLEWNLNSSGAGAVADVTFNWNSPSNVGASYVATGTGDLGNYTTGPNYAVTAIGTMSGTTKSVTGLPLTSGSNKLVLGNTNSVYVPAPINDLCTNAIALAIDASATSGTLLGATPTAGLTYAATKNDVWYTFTPAHTGTHTVTVSFASGPNIDIDIFKTTCPTSGAAPALLLSHSTTANPEIVSTTFEMDAVYYIRITDYDTNATAFTIHIGGPPPTLNTSVNYLSFSNSQAPLTQSDSRSFALSGFSLTGFPGSITVAAPNTDYQVSNDNATWGAVTTVNYTTSTLAATTLYVRFTPQSSGTKVGSITFSGAGVLTTPTVRLYGSGFLTTPIATAATSINANGFNANWNSVTAASSGYLLDVSTSSTFGTSTTGTLVEGFDNGTTPPSGWTFTTIEETYTNPGSFGAATPSLKLDATGDRVITPTLAGVATELVFWLKGQFITPECGLLVEGYNGTSWVTIEYSTVPTPNAVVQKTFNVSSTPALPSNITQFRFTYIKDGGGNLALDDINIQYEIHTPDFVSGYEAKPISGQTTNTDVVSSLTADTQYYYRLRATDGTPSNYSNVIAVKTRRNPVIWNGSEWSNTVGPNADLDAFIEGAYDTTTFGGFTANSIKINPSGSLIVNSGTTIKIDEELDNTLTSAAVVVENNGNLIQGGTTNQNSGTITVKRNSSALMRQDYTLWSSPTTGSQTLLDFSPATLANRFYTYNTTNNLLVAVPSPSTTTFDVAKGYLIRVPNTHPSTATIWEGSFVGVPNNGNISTTMVDNGAGFRFNLVGNPYPSPISATAFVENNTNTANSTGTLYFWRKTNNAASPTYSTWTIGGFTGNGEDQVFDPLGIIQTGQGFFVEASGNGTALEFNNSMRVDNHANQFFRTTNTVERNRIWLNATNNAGLFSQTLVGYMSDANNGIDATDGKYINDGAIAFTSIINETAYAIQGRSLPFDESDVVPMQFKATTAGTYTIAIDRVDGLFTGSQDIYLRDALTGVEHDLKSGGYSFATEAGTFSTRFEIVYTIQLGTNNPTLDANAVVIYKNDNQSFVINSGNTTMSSVKVFDIRGRLLTSISNINATQTVVTAGQSNEVLLVQVTSTDGATITKKVVR